MNEEHVKSTIAKEIEQQKDGLRYALKRLMFKMICLAVLGVAILSFWLYLSATTETVGAEILYIMGWVCVWEAPSIIVVERTELRRMWLNIDHLTKSKIIVQIKEDPEK